MDSGSVGISGIVPTLKYTVTGAHHFDYTTGSAMLIGSTTASSANTLFVAIPATRSIYSFTISLPSEKFSISAAFVRKSDGAVFLAGSDAAAPGEVGIYSVSLSATTASGAISKLGAVSLSVFGVDSAKISNDGKIYFLSADSSPKLVAFDTTNGLSSTLKLEAFDAQALFVCDSDAGAAPDIFALGGESADRGTTTRKLKEITNQGFASPLAITTDISSFIAGSSSCTNGVIRLVAENDSSGSVYSLDTKNETSFSIVDLAAGNIKILEEVQSAASLQRSAAFMNSKKLSKFTIVSAKRLEVCSKIKSKKNPLKSAKNLTLRAMAQKLRSVRGAGESCSFRS